MRPGFLRVLNRRLDAAFEEMEMAWAIYQQDRRDDAKLNRYVRALRRSNKLWNLIKDHSSP